MKRGLGARSPNRSRALTISLGAIVLLASGITIANYVYYHHLSTSSQLLQQPAENIIKTDSSTAYDLQLQTSPKKLEIPDVSSLKLQPDRHEESIEPRQQIESTRSQEVFHPKFGSEQPYNEGVKRESPGNVESPQGVGFGQTTQPSAHTEGQFWSPGSGLAWRVASHQTPTAFRHPACDPAHQQSPDNASPRRLNVLPKLYPTPNACASHKLQSLCSGLGMISAEGAVVVVVVSEGDLGTAAVFLDTASQALTNLLPVAKDLPSAAFLEKLGVAHYRYITPLSVEVVKWAVAADIVSVGCAVLLADPTVVMHKDVMAYLYKDSDVEAMSLSSKESDRAIRGKVVGIDDKDMGWSRYAQTMSVPLASSSLVYLAPTSQTLELAFTLAALPPEHPHSHLLTFNHLLFLPAANQHSRPGVSTRIMLTSCFHFGVASGLARSGHAVAMNMAGHQDPVQAMQQAVKPSGALAGVKHLLEGLRRRLQPGEDEKMHALNSNLQVTSTNAIITSQTLEHGKALALSQGCRVQPRQGPRPREMNYHIPLSSLYPPLGACAEGHLEELCRVLDKVHIRREVLVAVSNKNIFHMLGMYMDGVKSANISNALVVALDEETGRFCRERGFPYWVRTLTSRTGATDNHATSGLKFQILEDFMKVGASVLLSDVDIVWVQNPFPYLYRDADVEGMTDGWDDPTSYGWEWVSEVTGYPAPVTHQRNMRLSARNSGLFFLQATEESLSMMQRLKHRMATQDVWDQTAYNEEQFYVSYGGYASPGVSQRVMNYLCFLNSKALFRYVREDPDLYPDALRPVSVHVNYHPEKPQRMVDIYAQYHKGKARAIDKWNWGVGMKGATECLKRAPNTALQLMQSALGQRMIATGKAAWGGVKYVDFLAGGELKTPWGIGKWGVLDATATPSTFFADFAGAQHKLSVTSWPNFESKRCSDNERVQLVFGI